MTEKKKNVKYKCLTSKKSKNRIVRKINLETKANLFCTMRFSPLLEQRDQKGLGIKVPKIKTKNK